MERIINWKEAKFYDWRILYKYLSHRLRFKHVSYELRSSYRSNNIITIVTYRPRCRSGPWTCWIRPGINMLWEKHDVPGFVRRVHELADLHKEKNDTMISIIAAAIAP